MNSFIKVLEEQDTEVVVSSLVKTNKDVAFLKYLNDEGRKALFFEIFKEHPIKKGVSRSKATASLYVLAKSLGIGKVLLFLSELLNSKPANIHGRITIAKKKGYIPSVIKNSVGYEEAKLNYITMNSA